MRVTSKRIIVRENRQTRLSKRRNHVPFDRALCMTIEASRECVFMCKWLVAAIFAVVIYAPYSMAQQIEGDFGGGTFGSTTNLQPNQLITDGSTTAYTCWIAEEGAAKSFRPCRDDDKIVIPEGVLPLNPHSGTGATSFFQVCMSDNPPDFCKGEFNK
jgi:hypothetical protein